MTIRAHDGSLVSIAEIEPTIRAILDGLDGGILEFTHAAIEGDEPTLELYLD